jgi:hypothetical protein
MAVARFGAIFRVNGEVVPDYASPTYSAGVMSPPHESVDLLGRPVGARGWPMIEMRWDEIPLRGLQWWQEKIEQSSLSAPVSNLTLPDVRGIGRRIEGYAHHSTFATGLLWTPEIDPGGTWDIYSTGAVPLGEMYFVGSVVIKITELGRSER